MVELKKLREDAGISQSELARMCGVVRQTIGAVETRQNRPSVLLAKQFGIIFNMDWTLFFDDLIPVIFKSKEDTADCCLNCNKPVCDSCIG